MQDLTSSQASPNLFNGSNIINNNNCNTGNNKVGDIKILKEPERRHSSYDPASRAAGLANHNNGSNSNNNNCNNVPPTSTSARFRLCHSNSTASNGSGKGSSTAPINISGLPDPFGTPIASSLRGISGQTGNNPGTGSIYSSQESLTLQQHHHHRSSSVGSTSTLPPSSATSPRSASATRPSAGTPQFQNLSGAVRTVTSSASAGGNRSVTNLNGGASPAYVSVSTMQRSVSGQNLNQVRLGCS